MPRPGAPALPTRKLSPSLEGLPTPPAFPWGWSLTDSTAGAPTLAAAVRTGRRGGRKRERGGEGAEEAAEEGGGEGREPTRGEERGGAAIPQRRSCALSHLPPPPTARSPAGPLFSPHSLPALDPPKFFWGPFLHSLPSLESPAKVRGEVGAVCSLYKLPGSGWLGHLTGLKPTSIPRTLSLRTRSGEIMGRVGGGGERG